jgi:Tfp pilus assembly protein PilX
MHTRFTAYPHRISRTRSGMVLLLCLIFLMALSLLGLSASSDTILQNKLAANLQEAERARQSARLALWWAERWLLALDGPAPESCADNCAGLRLHAAGGLPPHPEFESLSWWMDQGHEAGIDPLSGDRISTISSDSANAPVWIIEAVQIIPPAEGGNADSQVWYRILARGSGRTDTSVSVVESIVGRSWPNVEEAGSPAPDGSGPCPGSELPVICGRYSWREIL